MATQIQSVIATQTLKRTHPDGTISNVDINIGDLTYMPSEAPDSSEYWISWTEVIGIGADDDYCQNAGEDSMQAVYLAMARAGLILSNADVASQLEYFSLPNFGYPTLFIPPDGSAVSGTVQMEMCNDAAQNITFEFRTPGTSPYDPTNPVPALQTVQQILTPLTPSGDTGSFSIPGVPDGAYDLAIKGYCWLRKVIPGVVVAGADVSGLSAFLIGGDINNDNVVDSSDFGTLIGDYGDQGDP